LGVESRGELIFFIRPHLGHFEVGITSELAPTKNLTSQADPQSKTVSIMHKNPQPLPPPRRLRCRRKVLLLKTTYILAFCFPLLKRGKSADSGRSGPDRLESVDLPLLRRQETKFQYHSKDKIYLVFVLAYFRKPLRFRVFCSPKSGAGDAAALAGPSPAPDPPY
jgi:hypothetical protein